MKNIFQRSIYLILIFFCFGLTLTGCNQQKQAAPTLQPPQANHIYRIGLIPEHNLFAQKKRYEPLLAYLSNELGATFEIVILPRYGNILDNFDGLALDGAFMGSFTGAMAIEKFNVEPIARPQYLGGDSTYYGIVFTRKGSGIHNAKDMQGKRMVFVDRATTAGYLLPLAYFKSLGVANYTSLFREYYFSGTHEDAILDVLNGLADIGAAKNTVFYRLAAINQQIEENLEILTTSPLVPSNGLMLRKDFPLELKNLMRTKLLAMDKTNNGRKILEGMNLEKFLETSINDYQPVRDYAASIGLNLTNYKYLNN